MNQTKLAFRYHDVRREGNGTIQYPMSRFDQKCAVEDCPNFGHSMRVTQSGFSVLYCSQHNVLAEAVFGS